MNRTPSQNIKFHALVNSLGLDADEKREIVRNASKGRAESSRDLTAQQMDWAIKLLEGQNVSRLARMRAKARAIASDMGVVKAGDYSRLDKWIKDKWKVDNLFMLPIDKLSECITALERWRDGNVKRAIKQQLNTF